jgi:hypothetical protein
MIYLLSFSLVGSRQRPAKQHFSHAHGYKVEYVPATQLCQEVAAGVDWPHDCAIDFDHIQTVSEARIGPQATKLSRDNLAR